MAGPRGRHSRSQVLVSWTREGRKGRPVKDGRNQHLFVNVCISSNKHCWRKEHVCAWLGQSHMEIPPLSLWEQGARNSLELRSQCVPIKCPKVQALCCAYTVTSSNAQEDCSHLTDGETGSEHEMLFPSPLNRHSQKFKASPSLPHSSASLMVLERA